MKTKEEFLEDCKRIAKDRGGECLSLEYKNNKYKMLWKCSCGNEWNSRYSDIKKGSWCPRCYGTIKYAIDDCELFAKKNGGKLLSTDYKDSKTPLRWQCSNGHVFYKSMNYIVRGKWCKICNRDDEILMIYKDCKQYADKFGGKIISKNIKAVDDVLEWECSVGHRWKRAFCSMKNRNNWCPKCSGRKKRTLIECISLAIERDGKCLSKEYKNNRTLMEWMCNNCGNVWKNTFCKINSGQWCPSCPSGKAQRKIGKYIKKLFDGKVEENYRRFSWLNNPKTNYPLELDFVLFDEDRPLLSIEYDGEQHFIKNKFKNTKKQFLYNKKLDFLKNKLMYQNRHIVPYFVRLNCFEEITEEKIKNLLKTYHLL